MSAIQEALERARRELDARKEDGDRSGLSWTFSGRRGKRWIPATILVAGIVAGMFFKWANGQRFQGHEEGGGLQVAITDRDSDVNVQASAVGPGVKGAEKGMGRVQGKYRDGTEDMLSKEISGLNRARELRLRGDVLGAKRELLSLLRAGVRTVRVLSALAELYVTDLGTPQEGVRLYHEALEMAPEDMGLRVNLGVAYLRNNELKKAEEELSLVLRVKPQMVEALYNMACVKAIQGKRDEARGLVERAARIDQRVWDWAKDDQDLKGLRDILPR